MKRRTQTILYHLLPVVFWVLAIGGAMVPLLLVAIQLSPFTYLIPVVPVMCGMLILTSLKRHADSVEECFFVAILLGVGSYWLPAIVFLAVPACLYLYTRNLLVFRSVMALLLGYTLVAIWIAVFVYFSLITFHFSLTENAYGWIPIGAVLFAWTASTIARRNLRVR